MDNFVIWGNFEGGKRIGHLYLDLKAIELHTHISIKVEPPWARTEAAIVDSGTVFDME